MKGLVVREPHRAELGIQECRLFVGRINAYFRCSSQSHRSLLGYPYSMTFNGVLQVSVHHDDLTGYLRRRHSVSKLVVHLIFTTKYRRKLLDGTMIEQMRGAFLSAAEKLEIDILEMDGEADHVHLLVAYPPKLAVSVLVNNLKSISSRQIRILNTHLRKQSNSGLLWSRSYFACSAGGATIETLKAYVASQNTPD